MTLPFDEIRAIWNDVRTRKKRPRESAVGQHTRGCRGISDRHRFAFRIFTTAMQRTIVENGFDRELHQLLFSGQTTLIVRDSAPDLSDHGLARFPRLVTTCSAMERGFANCREARLQTEI